ncbi:hypothetical protein DCS_07885 [Drechmeria coniospora]|uniref:Reticulocyte-binding protein 2 like protein a n=1 Tax=Drechmeria coniospora TaxID=98403 RepID=A0A151GFP0_DRECN|nr:hypothetical protein DCS_07885 [Drechmeria coniospora]KYK55920.1 hypothetical protein DCS_07885 [Drechmeria coniospora]
MANYYHDEDDVDIHVRHRGYTPYPISYVQSQPRPRSYQGVGATGPSYFIPERHTTVMARSRSRSRTRRASPPLVAPVLTPANPVIINNRIYNDCSSDDEAVSGHRGHPVCHGHSPDPRSRSRSSAFRTREDWESEHARRELEQLRLVYSHDKEERRLAKEYRDEGELRRAKRELDDMKKRQALADEEARIKKELELKRLQEEEHAAQEKKLREKEATEAVERYKKHEAKRIAKEAMQKEENDKEYKRRLQDDLLNSGLDETTIAAIINKSTGYGSTMEPGVRPTYTRMARRHLSIETLRTFRVDFDFDPDPEYILVKRWVPEWEQDQFWKHTKIVRERRSGGGMLLFEDKKHRHLEPEFEWVRKKSDRKRSKSPGLLMYLAGGRPA